MRLQTLAIIASLILMPAAAQGQSNDKESSGTQHDASRFGGYFGTDARITRVKGATGTFVGGEFALLIAHRYVVGFSGLGLASDRARVGGASGPSQRLGMGYGGIRLGYIARSECRLRPTFDVLVGDASIAGAGHPREFDRAFVLEPALGLDAPIAAALHLGVAVTYRYVSDVSLVGVRASDLRAFSGQVALRVGRF